MGDRGPAGKRSDQRLGHHSAAENAVDSSDRDVAIQPPFAPDEDWHPVARQWYLALGRSGQAIYYTEGDWATAYLVAESLSRDMHPRYVGMNGTTGEEIIRPMPISGASLSAYMKSFTDLLVTEAQRRRVSVELNRNGEQTDESGKQAQGKVTNARARFEPKAV